jgi:hypothetical protein
VGVGLEAASSKVWCGDVDGASRLNVTFLGVFFTSLRARKLDGGAGEAFARNVRLLQIALVVAAVALLIMRRAASAATA